MSGGMTSISKGRKNIGKVKVKVQVEDNIFLTST
jgi:hypothetical protein